MEKLNKQLLLKKLSEGETFTFKGFINGVLSNWYPTEFVIEGVKYKSVEQYFMAKKAEFFGDNIALGRILETPDPKRAKEIGRQVRLFDEQAWLTVSEEFMQEGTLQKYKQNPQVARILQETKSDILVECNSADLIWGAGIAMQDQRLNEPFEWPGINKLGFILTEVRETLKEK